MKDELIFCLVVVGLLAACVLALVVSVIRMQRRMEAQQEKIKNLIQLNAKLRSSRHDYLNSMQVAYGLMELNEYEELHKYLEPMYKDIMKTGKALKTSIPAVNALLMAKMNEAENAGIDFYIEVNTNLKGLEIGEWEICRILANLLDNANRACIDSGKPEKKIWVNISETQEKFIFEVGDNGVSIREEDRENIFKQGFTTKKEPGHGLGLDIVRRLVNKNKGDVRLVCLNDDEKYFEVGFRKEES